MNDTVKLAVVGDRDSILVFHTLGIKSYPARTVEEAEAAVRAIVSADTRSVIFITEPVFAMIPEVVNRYKSQTFPVLIPIPDRMGTDGTGMQGIQENVKKAIGFDIFEADA